MRKMAILALGAALAEAAFGQSAKQPFLGMKNPDAPIEVSADNFAADANAKTGVYSGNVVIHQGDVRMRANSVRINAADGKPDKIYAQGNVVVDAPSGVATGDNGVYDVAPRTVTLTGHVVLTKDKNVMRGPLLTVNLITGVAQLGGGGQTTGGRIQALFVPQSQTKQNP